MPRPSSTARHLRLLREAWPSLSGRIPSLSGLARVWGLSSKSGARAAAVALVAAGKLARSGNGFVPAAGFFSLPVVEGVPAGFPAEGSEGAAYDMDVASWLVPKPAGTALVKVKGLSMRDAGILPDDLLAVEKGREPREGDVVVAEVDGAWTVKRYAKGPGGRAYLKAENPDFPDIRAAGEIRVFGVVSSVMRKLR